MKTATYAALIGLITICFIAAPNDLMAFGFGVAGSVASGDLKASSESLFGYGTPTARYDQTRRSIGVIYDTNVGRDAIFNYRLGISYQDLKARSSEGRFRLEGVSIENDFGFSLVRSEALRLWVGPELKIEYLEGNNETATGYQDHMGVLGVGVGPVAGVNYRLGNDVSLTVKGGYLFQEGVRLFSEWEERYGFLNIGLIFRLGRDKGDYSKDLTNTLVE